MALTYQLNNVLPIPLKEAILDSSSIWKSSMAIDCSQFNLIKASSGTGKSSFVAFLYGLRSDYSGTILLNNKSIAEHSTNDWASLRQSELAIVWQNLKLFPELTGIENIAIKTKLHKKSLSKDQIVNMATALDIGDKLEQPCKQLSMGQQQRIALLRALSQPFSFLILDEPFSHLDKVNIAKACSLIEKRCTDQGAGILLTSLGESYPLPFTNTFIL